MGKLVTPRGRTPRSLAVDQGGVWLHRYGNLKPVGQSADFRSGWAPAPRGLWCFPWPFFDWTYAMNKDLLEVAPKRLTAACPDTDADERELEAAIGAWVQTKTPYRLRRFRHHGTLHARLDRRGRPGARADGWPAWFEHTPESFVRAARRYCTREGVTVQRHGSHAERLNADERRRVGVLEVFVAA